MSKLVSFYNITKDYLFPINLNMLINSLHTFMFMGEAVTIHFLSLTNPLKILRVRPVNPRAAGQIQSLF